MSETEKEQLPLERQPWWQRAGLSVYDLISYGLILMAAIFVVSYLASNLIQNYQMKQQITAANNDLNQTKLDQERLQSLLVYYNTKSYQEIELRRRLLLRMPDETVVALKGGQPLPDPMPDTTKKTAPVPSWQLWWQFYTSRRS